MAFDVPADAYDRFMGRYSSKLSRPFADFAGIESGQRVLDVGCGPGALTAELVARAGAESVAAVDPSEPFVEAARSRLPGVDVQLSAAEDLPHPGDAFDATLAQLAVHFMTDPVAGTAEMARVTRAGGVVAASVWDLAGDRAPISPFWQAARELDADVQDESLLAGTRAGHLSELLGGAGLREVEEVELSVAVEHESFEEWWRPFTLGVGPAGAYARSLGQTELAQLRERCRNLLREEPFTLTTYAWAARGVV